MPDSGSTVFFAKMRNNLGLYYALSGAKLIGEDVYSVGLADYFVPQERLQELEKAFGEVIDENITLDKLKKVVEKYHVAPKQNQIEHEDIIKDAFGGETLKEVFTRLSELSKSSEFAKNVLTKLKKYPPRAQRIIFKQYNNAKNMDINQGLEQDYRLSR